jgi:twitching motility two-component system response regulator PilG
MSATQHFSVGVFGVTDLEKQVLERIFSLSVTRPHAYRMLVEPDSEPVDIVLVDRMNSAAVIKAQSLLGNGIPVVGVIRDRESNEPYFVRRPLTATRTLGVLDRVVEKEFLPRTSTPSPAPDSPPSVENRLSPPESKPTPHAPASASEPARPLRGAAKAQPSPVDSGEFQKIFFNSGYRALVVDDSLPVRKQVAMALERSGISADFADNGDAALDLIYKNDYDVIFLDVIMPGADGYEVCKSIKRDKEKKRIPVVMLTGKSSPFDKVKGKLSGCDTYLTKPVSIREFNRTLNRCLKEPLAFESMAGLT